MKKIRNFLYVFGIRNNLDKIDELILFINMLFLGLYRKGINIYVYLLL